MPYAINSRNIQELDKLFKTLEKDMADFLSDQSIPKDDRETLENFKNAFLQLQQQHAASPISMQNGAIIFEPETLQGYLIAQRGKVNTTLERLFGTKYNSFSDRLHARLKLFFIDGPTYPSLTTVALPKELKIPQSFSSPRPSESKKDEMMSPPISSPTSSPTPPTSTVSSSSSSLSTSAAPSSSTVATLGLPPKSAGIPVPATLPPSSPSSPTKSVSPSQPPAPKSEEKSLRATFPTGLEIEVLGKGEHNFSYTYTFSFSTPEEAAAMHGFLKTKAEKDSKMHLSHINGIKPQGANKIRFQNYTGFERFLTHLFSADFRPDLRPLAQWLLWQLHNPSKSKIVKGVPGKTKEEQFKYVFGYLSASKPIPNSTAEALPEKDIPFPGLPKQASVPSSSPSSTSSSSPTVSSSSSPSTSSSSPIQGQGEKLTFSDFKFPTDLDFNEEKRTATFTFASPEDAKAAREFLKNKVKEQYIQERRKEGKSQVFVPADGHICLANYRVNTKLHGDPPNQITINNIDPSDVHVQNLLSPFNYDKEDYVPVCNLVEWMKDPRCISELGGHLVSHRSVADQIKDVLELIKTPPPTFNPNNRLLSWQERRSKERGELKKQVYPNFSFAATPSSSTLQPGVEAEEKSAGFVLPKQGEFVAGTTSVNKIIFTFDSPEQAQQAYDYLLKKARDKVRATESNLKDVDDDDITLSHHVPNCYRGNPSLNVVGKCLIATDKIAGEEALKLLMPVKYANPKEELRAKYIRNRFMRREPEFLKDPLKFAKHGFGRKSSPAKIAQSLNEEFATLLSGNLSVDLRAKGWPDDTQDIPRSSLK